MGLGAGEEPLHRRCHASGTFTRKLRAPLELGTAKAAGACLSEEP